MEGWKDGMMEGWNGEMVGRWKVGMVEWWGDGMVEKWSGAMMENFERVTGIQSWALEQGTLVLKTVTKNGLETDLVFSAIASDIWRMRFLPGNPAEIAHANDILTDLASSHQPIDVAETANEIKVTGVDLALEIQRQPWAFRFLDPTGFAVLRDNPGDVDGLGRPFVLPLGFVSESNQVRQVCLSLHLRPDEHLFGLGEKFTPLDKRCQRIVSWNQDALGSTSERSHKNIPLLWSSRGYGLFLASSARITWDLGVTSCQSYTITVDDAGLDAFIIYGPEPAKILQRYADLCGHAPVPPRWSFGLWLSSGGTYRDQAAIEALVAGAQARDLPADVIHIDPWWLKWRQYCDFRWDRQAFPEPEKLIAALHQAGLKVCLWEHPYISVESDLYPFGCERGYFVKRPDGSVYIIDYGLSLAPRPDGVVRQAIAENSWNARVAIIDLTQPEAYAWFQDLHRPLLRQGVDVFKTDFGEDIPSDAVFANGQTGATVHNLYPLLYNRAVFEVTQQERGYGLVWSRCGTAGNQRYPVCWSGDPAADFDSLASTIRGGLSAGLSGLPFWSNDIGGYRGQPTPELYVRWAQFGLMCSHSRMHGDSPREPWIYGPEALKIVKKYVQLRYRLFPYLYSLAHAASRTGMPVIRAMPLAFPEDPNCFDQDLQFMLGPWLLVAPIYDASTSRLVYFPAGEWYDFDSGDQVIGSANLRIHAPLGKLSLFVRAGAILPLMLPQIRIPEAPPDPLILEIYPSAQSEFILYEDEGQTRFRWSKKNNTGQFEFNGPNQRRWQLRFHHLPALSNFRTRIDADQGSKIPGRLAQEKNIQVVELPACKSGEIEMEL